MKILIPLLISSALFAADPPKPTAPAISTQDKLEIRELQIKLMNAVQVSDNARKAAEAAQAALMEKVRKVQPEGWQITDDQNGGLVLVVAPKPEPPKKADTPAVPPNPPKK